ncbi:hypothetical protein LINPERHAP2_LOCUS39377 [Linum perenne]
MWRQTLSEHSDSDHILSDDEDFNGGNSVSFSVDSDKKQSIPLQSRLEILRAKEELHCREKDVNFPLKKSFLVEDELEEPDFPNDDGLTLSIRAECIHNVDENSKYVFSKDTAAPNAKHSRPEADVPSLNCAMKHEAWPMVSEEAKALNHLHETSRSSLRQTCKSSKGVKGRAKPRFSFQFQPSISRDRHVPISQFHERSDWSEANHTVTAETTVHRIIGRSDAENEKWSEIPPTKLESAENHVTGHSISELLDGIQDKNLLSKKHSNSNDSTSRKRLQQAMKRSLLSSLRDETFDQCNEESEPLSLGSSTDEEIYRQDKEVFNPEKNVSMVDLFQEALATSILNNEGSQFIGPNLSSNSLFGRLQLVMQSEKKMDADFMKKLQMRARPNDISDSLVVKILSRYMEAKLTICVCSFGKIIEAGSFIPRDDEEMKNTVVFNPRVCNEVDLGMGNWICIHPPWNKVQVMGSDDTIILASYFYQVFG